MNKRKVNFSLDKRKPSFCTKVYKSVSVSSYKISCMITLAKKLNDKNPGEVLTQVLMHIYNKRNASNKTPSHITRISLFRE